MHPISGVDHRGVGQVPSYEMGCATFAVSNDKDVRTHRFEGPNGIEEGLSLRHRAAGFADVNGISRESLCSDLKTCSCAGAWFEKKIDDGFATKRRYFLDISIKNFDELLPVIQQQE
jgi:hypothetical protein